MIIIQSKKETKDFYNNIANLLVTFMEERNLYDELKTELHRNNPNISTISKERLISSMAKYVTKNLEIPFFDEANGNIFFNLFNWDDTKKGREFWAYLAAEFSLDKRYCNLVNDYIIEDIEE